MNDFAAIIHPVNLELLHIFDEGTKRGRKDLTEKVLEWTPAFKASRITGARSITGKEIDGYFVMCPLLPNQMLTMDPKFVVKRVVEAGKIAESLGVKIIGLGAYVALVGKRGALIAKNLNIPVTAGTSYTIAIALEGIFTAAKAIGLKLNDARAAIIGATGTIGSICSNILAEKVRFLYLVARNKQRLSDLVYNIRNGKKNIAKLEISDNIKTTVCNSDIVLTSTNTPEILIELSNLKPGTIVCDISQPRNVSEEQAKRRDDILVIDGGVVKPPGEVNFNFNFGLASGLTFACIAEAMILAFEERYESYSIGGNITLKKVKEIFELGRKHGFELAKLRSFDTEIKREKIEKVKKARRNTTGFKIFPLNNFFSKKQ